MKYFLPIAAAVALSSVSFHCGKKVMKTEPAPIYAGEMKTQEPAATIVYDQGQPAENVEPERGPIRLTVLYGFDSDAMLPDSKMLLEGRMADMAGRTVRLTGGACPIGEEDYNYLLGMRRAEAVKNFLVAHARPSPASISIQSVGEQNLITDNPKQYNLNRRCEITID